MKIDPSKLQNVQHKPDGSFVARCPACAEHGTDNKGDHLVVYPDGKFGCVANSGDKVHNKAIMRAAGKYSNDGQIKLPVNRLRIPESRTIKVLGRLGPHSASPLGFGEEKTGGLIPPVDPEPIFQSSGITIESTALEATLSVGKEDGWSVFSPLEDHPAGYGSGSLERGSTDEEIAAFLAG